MDFAFFNLVYDYVRTVPRGTVVTYGSVAAAVGFPRRARSVGQAMAYAEGRDIPAHRVVGSGGRLAPAYAFGEGEQRRMLEAEGVEFTASGKVKINFIYK